MIRVHVLPCGGTIVDEALPFSDKSRDPLAFTGIFRGKKHKRCVPVKAYLIEHPKGLILVDTGWDDAIRKNARAYEGFFNYFASPGFLPEGEGIIDQLAGLGYRTRDLDCCLLTHLDIDHAGGIGEVRDAGHIMCSAAEWKAANKSSPRYLRRLWKNVRVETFPDRPFDVFRDGTVVAFPMHGHSAGMTAIRVGSDDHYIIIAGDAGYGRASWERQVLPGVEWNRKETAKSLRKLRSFALDPHCEAVLMTHDTEKTKSVFEL
ncbi:MAG: N-acyl homoserine lactonase family protein [Anaerovoracaceae bacterium]